MSLMLLLIVTASLLIVAVSHTSLVRRDELAMQPSPTAQERLSLLFDDWCLQCMVDAKKSTRLRHHRRRRTSSLVEASLSSKTRQTKTCIDPDSADVEAGQRGEQKVAESLERVDVAQVGGVEVQAVATLGKVGLFGVPPRHVGGETARGDERRARAQQLEPHLIAHLDARG